MVVLIHIFFIFLEKFYFLYFLRPFFMGLFLEGVIYSEGLIYGGKLAFQNRLG